MPAIYKLRDWVKKIGVEDLIEKKQKKEESKYWSDLSANSKSMDVLEANQDKIDWYQLSRNPNAIRLLEANQDKIDWSNLSNNPNAIHLLEANQDKIDWCELSYLPSAIHLLEANQDKIDWDSLCGNTAAIHLLENNLDKFINSVGLDVLMNNKAALSLLETIFQINDPDDPEDHWWVREILNSDLNKFKPYYSSEYFMDFYERNIDLIEDVTNINKYPYMKMFIREHFELVPTRLYQDLYDKPWMMSTLMDNIDMVFHYEILTTIFYNFDDYSYDPNDQLPEFNNDFDTVIQALCYHEWFESICERYQDEVNEYTLADMCDHEWLFPIVSNQVHRFDEDCWSIISKKEWAIDLLEANQDKVVIKSLSMNKAIYALDYMSMKQAIACLHEELIAYVHHPNRVAKWIDKYGIEGEYLE